MLSQCRGALALLEYITPQISEAKIRLRAERLSLPPLDVNGPTQLRKASEHWQLYKLGITSELPELLKALSRISSLGYFVSFALDISRASPHKAWALDHPRRVAAIAQWLATDGIEYAIQQKLLRWSSRPTKLALDGILVGSLLHDIGKLLLPEQVLPKASLSDSCYHKSYREHPTLGYQALKPLSLPWPDVLLVVLYHHENIQGSGYPEGLIKEDIPWPAQIVGLANFCDNLLAPQAYKRTFDQKKLIEVITNEAASLYHPALIKALLHVWDKIIYSFDSSSSG